jgi:16S rRNA (cytosine1402-N4)-methyltransferase
MSTKHTPVYLEESIEALKVEDGGTYIDATVGQAGHLKNLLDQNKTGKVLGIDWDTTQIEAARETLKEYKNLTLVQSNFAHIEDVAKAHGFTDANGILIDLGLSYKQLVEGGRGLSYRQHEETLDMRLDTKEGDTAADILNSYTEEQLKHMFIMNAEEIHAVAIARSIIITRQTGPVIKVHQLVACIERAIGHKDEAAAARVFQALRIEVNHEFANLETTLQGSLNILVSGGRLVVIVFHSLEGRIVKKFTQKEISRIQLVEHYKNRRGKSFEKSAILYTIIKL